LTALPGVGPEELTLWLLLRRDLGEIRADASRFNFAELGCPLRFAKPACAA
jgi:hypothetical protein